MTGWHDLRVATPDLPAAALALMAAGYRQLVIDADPPAAGPEVEITVRATAGLPQPATAIEADGTITVLACRTRTWPRQDP